MQKKQKAILKWLFSKLYRASKGRRKTRSTIEGLAEAFLVGTVGISIIGGIVVLKYHFDLFKEYVIIVVCSLVLSILLKLLSLLR